MKKMIRKMSTFTLGMIVGITFTGATAVGAATYLKATQSNVKIVVDGTQAKLSDSPLNVNGRLYLPVRDTANAMGYSVESVTSSQVSLKEGQSTNNNSTTNATPSGNSNTTISKQVKNLKETYSTDGKLDAEKIRTALNSGSLDLNAQDSINGKTLLMLVIEEDNFEAYKAIKRNNLNVNLKQSDGKTALHIAVLENNVFYFGELTGGSYKADASLKDDSNKRPIDYTEKGSANEIDLKIYMM